MHVMLRCIHKCNFNCVYCFEKRTNKSNQRMDLDILDVIFGKLRYYMGRHAAPDEAMSFEWTGGEPLLLGEEYFRKAFELQKKYFKTYKGGYRNGIQTNGSLITKKYLRLFEKYRVGLGVSTDVISGTRFEGKRDRTMDVHRKIMMLIENRIPFGCIVVVTRRNVKVLKDIYELMKDADIGFHFNFLKRLDFEYDASLTPTVDEIVDSMMEVAEVYVRDRERGKDCKSFINLDYVIKTALFGRSDVSHCHQWGCFKDFLSIEPDGSAYPCPSFTNEDTYLGNIHSHSVASMMRHPLRGMIAKRQRHLYVSDCNNCYIKDGCRGGCMAEAYYEHGGNVMNRASFECEYLQKIVPRIWKLMAGRRTDWINNASK